MSTASLDFGDTFSRRLPIYLVIDNSESMVGEPLDAVNQGLLQLISELRKEPMAVETARISVISFSNRARQIIPLTDIARFAPPTLSVGPGTSLGAAFELLGQSVKNDVRKSTTSQKGDWKPIVFLLTDGLPTDDWQVGFSRFEKLIDKSEVNIIAIGCGEDADLGILKIITPNVLVMKNMSPGDFAAFFKWVSASVTTASVSASREGGGMNLPTPPGTLEVVGAVNPSKGTTPQSQIILAARCRDTKNGYLMRYRRGTPSGDSYQVAKAYKVGNDYFGEASVGPVGQEIDSSKLKGAPLCPYCGRPGWTLAKDGKNLICSDSLDLGSKQAQVMFVLDITGSMYGEIDGVKENIKDFMDFVQAEGLSVEVGLIAFRDLEMGEPPDVLKFRGKPFTKDAAAFKSQVSTLTANGGGDNPGESSFDALVLATRQPFGEQGSRIIVLITDEPPLIPDGKVRNVNDVISAMERSGIDQIHIVIPDHLRADYQALHKHFKGQVFQLGAGCRGGASFRKILMDIGRSISVMTRVG